MTTLFILLLIVSITFRVFLPKKINSIYGYKTRRSKQNITKWKLANKYSANLMLIVMTVLLVISLVFEFFSLEYNNILIGLLLFGFILIIGLTENKLSEK